MAMYKPKPVPDTWRFEDARGVVGPIIQEDGFEGVTQADMDEYHRFTKQYASWRATLGNAMQWRVPASLPLATKPPREIEYCPRSLLDLKLCGNSPLTPFEEAMVKKYVEEQSVRSIMLFDARGVVGPIIQDTESSVELYIRRFTPKVEQPVRTMLSE